VGKSDERHHSRVGLTSRRMAGVNQKASVSPRLRVDFVPCPPSPPSRALRPFRPERSATSAHAQLDLRTD
jgi:hypothetical protein